MLMLTACLSRPYPDPDPLATYLKEADTFISQRHYAQAVKTLEEAAEVYPNSLAPLIRIGQIYLVQHRPLLAEDAFNRALAREGQSSLATAGLAEALSQQGKSGRALELWQQAIDLNPNTPGVFSGLGRTQLARLEFEAAQQTFLKQQQHQSDPEALWFLAVLVAPLDVQAANEYLLAIPAEAPNDVLIRRDYLLTTLVPFDTKSPPATVAKSVGIALAQAELWPLAIHTLTSADNLIDTQEAPGNKIKTEKAETLAFLGYALAQAGRPALNLFEQAHTLDPTSPWPAYFYGIYLRQQNAFKAAEVQFTEAISLDPDNAAFYIELAHTKTAQGDFIAAENLYDTAVIVSEDDPQILLAMIRFYAIRGYKLAEAGIPLAEVVIDDDPDNAVAHDLLGWMQFLDGSPDEAIITLRQAIELDPHLISARYHLARVLAQSGQLTEAKAAYQQVIDWDTRGGLRDSALRELQQLGP